MINYLIVFRYYVFTMKLIQVASNGDSGNTHEVMFLSANKRTYLYYTVVSNDESQDNNTTGSDVANITNDHHPQMVTEHNLDV